MSPGNFAVQLLSAKMSMMNTFAVPSVTEQDDSADEATATPTGRNVKQSSGGSADGSSKKKVGESSSFTISPSKGNSIVLDDFSISPRGTLGVLRFPVGDYSTGEKFL